MGIVEILNCSQVTKTEQKEWILVAKAAPQKRQFFEKLKKMEAKGSPNSANSQMEHCLLVTLHDTILRE